MAAENSVRPVIIKRKKVVAGDGHHGGAWKVAYADFVTAMMAFFMLMWLLNATTEKQRKGIADYFSPTIPITMVSGGGDGALNGSSLFTEQTLSRNGTGGSGHRPVWQRTARSAQSQGEASGKLKEIAEEVNSMVIGSGGESTLLSNAMRHVVSKVTDEGVVIELFDLDDSPLFTKNNRVTPVLKRILSKITDVLRQSKNPIAIKVHVKQKPIVEKSRDLWRDSSERSVAVRNVFNFQGLEGDRIKRLVSHAAQFPTVADGFSARNNRIEITILHEP